MWQRVLLLLRAALFIEAVAQRFRAPTAMQAIRVLACQQLKRVGRPTVERGNHEAEL
jgi:hypothetical protein